MFMVWFIFYDCYMNKFPHVLSTGLEKQVDELIK